jgi:hypothetical protein
MPDVAPGPADAALPPIVQVVLDALDPLPAAVYDGRFGLLAHNAAYRRAFPGIAAATGIERNALWQLLVHHEGQGLLTRAAVPRMVAVVRANFARHLGEPDWEVFVAALSDASPAFREAWRSQSVAAPGPQRKAFDYPGVGVVELDSASFSVAGTPEARMIVYTPADETSAARLAQLGGSRTG